MTVRRRLTSAPGTRTTLVRDEHGAGDRFEEVHVHTEIFDDALVERNKRIRIEGLLQPKAKMPVLDGAEIQGAFSIPPMAYHFIVKKDPDIIEGLCSRDARIRESALRRFRLLYGKYEITAANR